jgi:CHAT domain-containing protein
LTITDLAAQPTQQRGLAFLSACQTASGSIYHLNEAIHLAAAMEFLGYRHVIATMWAV